MPLLKLSSSTTSHVWRASAMTLSSLCNKTKCCQLLFRNHKHCLIIFLQSVFIIRKIVVTLSWYYQSIKLSGRVDRYSSCAICADNKVFWWTFFCRKHCSRVSTLVCVWAGYLELRENFVRRKYGCVCLCVWFFSKKKV